VESGTVVPRDVARPCGEEHPLPIKACGTLEAIAPPRTVSRVQSCVTTGWEILLRPRLGEGRNNVLLMKSLLSGFWRWLR
jgi:hypothetical protein